MKRSLILGYGITGKSFEAYLSKRNINFDILDEQKGFIPDNFTSTESFYLKRYGLTQPFENKGFLILVCFPFRRLKH